jgi:hypothetical protein
MTQFIIKYWIEVLFGVVISLIGYLIKKIKSWTKEQDEVKGGVLAILHDRLFQAGRFFCNQGYISFEEIKNIEYLYKSYHALGGNGTGTEIFERIKSLPIKD